MRAEYWLNWTIQGTIDVCAVLVRELNLGVPGEEEDLCEKLSGQVLSEDMVDTLQEMMRFRKVLVHRYRAIDDDKVYHLLTHRLHDFREFKKEVVHF